MRRWEEDVTVQDLQLQRLRLEPGLCLWCGYNLAGLAADAICPECGKPREAEKALPRCPEEKLLRHAPAAWRRRVVLGVRMLDWAGWLVCVLAVCFSLTMCLLFSVFDKAQTGMWGEFWFFAVSTMVAGALVLGVSGSWLITTPPPEGGISLRARRMLRWSAIVLAALQLAWFAPRLLTLQPGALPFRWVGLAANVLAALWGWSLLRACARLEWHTSRWSHRRTNAYSTARGTFAGVLALGTIGSALMRWADWREGATLGWIGLFERADEQGHSFGQLIVFLAWVLWAFAIRGVVPAMRGEHRPGCEITPS